MEKIKIKGIDEEIYFTTSKCGLPIYVWKSEYAKSFYLSLNVHYGSIHTEFSIDGKKYKVPQGIAHFMEHIKFNVDKDTTANDLFDPLGSDINAFTTFRYTSYLVYGTSKIKENLYSLLDYVYNPYFTKDMIKKEKGIITSEINMGKDQPYNQLYFAFNKAMYHKEKYKYLITGEVEDIKRVELDDIELIYQTFYHPKNMFLIVTGNVNPYEIEQMVNDNLDRKEFSDYLVPKIAPIKEPKNVVSKEIEVSANVEVEKAKIGLKIPKKKFKDLDNIKLNIILNIILSSNFGDSSDLKEELLQNNIITFLTASRFVLDEYVIIDVTVESKILDEAIKRIVDALKNLVIDEAEFKRKINSSIATLVLNYEDVENVNNMIQNYLVYYKKLVPDLKEIYESISFEEVKEVIDNFDTKEMVVVKMKKQK
ncbi:m16 family metallopeptidase [Mycoplasma sp. CAG:776]|nr:m16 family metallopeptidase [Mycoplasma sp. CAG:776]